MKRKLLLYLFLIVIVSPTAMTKRILLIRKHVLLALK